MIRKINVDEIDIIDPILTKFGQEVDSSVPPTFIEILRTSIIDGKSFAYGSFIDNNTLNGIGLFGNVSKRISVVYAEGISDIEKKLLDTIFTNHSPTSPYIGVGGAWVTDSISNHLVGLGFRKIDRAYMTLDKISIGALEEPLLPNTLEFEVYHESEIDELAQLMFRSNNGQIDQIIFPNFFGTTDTCKELIKNIVKSVYGDYKEPYSWLLREGGKLVGACFITTRDKGGTGYIPDIVIDPDYQGKGLGKAILIHSMKETLAGEPSITEVGLDVTLENKAKFLYKSIGFETKNEYSMYTWLNKQNN